MIVFTSLFVLCDGCKKESGNNKNNNPPPSIIDVDGNVYHSVTIGTQVWMVENLKVTHYRNGEGIPNVTDQTQWSVLITDAYCIYNNDVTKKAEFGVLYNWYVIKDSRNIAPAGWHVPSDAEWAALLSYLGDDAATKLKEAGVGHWLEPAAPANIDNLTGFTALSGGFRSFNGLFGQISSQGFWWTSSKYEYSDTDAWSYIMQYNISNVARFENLKKCGFPVRCIKD